MPANNQNSPSFFSTQGVKDFLQKTYVDKQPEGVRTPNTASATQGKPTTPSTQAPAKAPAAPNPTTITVFTGLCDALNQFQQELVKSGTYKVADQYEIVFAPDTIKSESVVMPGTVDYKSTAMADNKNAKVQLDSKTDTMQTKSKAISVTAGTQIVQFIDQVMKGSSYVTNQANIIFNPATGQASPNPKASKTGGVNWYKITFNATPLGYDEKRNDYAYKMTFIINQYPVTDLESQFFNKGTYRGPHKVLNYWFTGKNTQVLDFEQEYDMMYFQILNSSPEGKAGGGLVPAGLTNQQVKPADNMPPLTKAFTAGSSQSTQYSSKSAGLVGASAADYLYSITNKLSARLKIIGDPAWLMQGELTNSINAANFSWAPFNDDGTINYEAGPVMFELIYNRPGDYNFETGIVETTTQTRNVDGSLSLLQPQAHLIYTATKVTSMFNQGKFTQELEGKAWTGNFEKAENLAKEQGRENKDFTSKDPATAARQANLAKEGIAAASLPVAGGNGQWDGEVPSDPGPSTQARAGNASNPTPQAAAPAQLPTSNGDIDYNAGLAGTSPTQGQQTLNTQPQIMAAKDDAE